MLLPLELTGAKLLRVPPLTMTSLTSKLLEASLSVKLMVSALLKVPLPDRLTTMVGGVLSVLTGKLTRLLASYTSLPLAGLEKVSLFRLPAASANLAESTPMVAVPRVPGVGVKVAV